MQKNKRNARTFSKKQNSNTEQQKKHKDIQQNLNLKHRKTKETQGHSAKSENRIQNNKRNARTFSRI